MYSVCVIDTYGSIPQELSLPCCLNVQGRLNSTHQLEDGRC